MSGRASAQSADGLAISINIGNLHASVATGANSMAGGYGSSASGANSTVFGTSASDNGVDHSTVVGAGASIKPGLVGANVAIGEGSIASTGAQPSYQAYGLRGTQSSFGEVSVGSDAGGSRTITHVAAGVSDTDAVNVGQLKGATADSVQYESANGIRTNRVNLQGGSAGPVTVSNVAAGTQSTDAVNVGQLRGATADSVQYETANGARTNRLALQGGTAGAVTISNVAAGTQGTDAVNLNQLRSFSASSTAQANAYTDQRISDFANMTNAQIGRARSDAAGGAAIALAATGIRFDDRPGKFSIGGATSYYHDQMGLAVGLGHTSEDGRLRMNASIAASPTMSRPDVGGVVGASYSLN